MINDIISTGKLKLKGQRARGNKYYIEEQCKVAILTERVNHAERSTHNSSMKAATQQSNNPTAGIFE